MNETIAPSTTAAAPQETPTPAPPIAPFVEPYSHADLSPSHAATMIEWERDNLLKGKITPEEAERRFDALGATPEQRAPDSRSAEVKLLDQHFPAAKPEEFFIRYADPGQPTSPMSTELRAFDTHARAWLSGTEFPCDIGNSLITQIERTVHATKGMTPDQLESYGLVEYEKLERAYGDTLDEKLRAAAVMIDALDKKQPGLKQLLQARGIGDNALVASMLIHQAERWHARRRGR